MTKPLEALIAKIRKQIKNFDTVILKEDEALSLIAALEQSQRDAKRRGITSCELFDEVTLLRTRITELQPDNRNALLPALDGLDEIGFRSVVQAVIDKYASLHVHLTEKVNRIAELESSQLAVKLPEEFAVIGENLRTQDNRITSDPMFCIYQKEEIVVDEEYDHDRIVWWNNEHCHEASKLRAKRLELLHHDGRDTPEEWRRIAVKEINDFVTCCFTEQGCKDYLAINGHNLRKPFIYVKSGFRNNEYQMIRNWLMFAGINVQGDE